ncbi:MAG: hypothetical protein ACLQOO_32295 [Terriglobia bacterium]
MSRSREELRSFVAQAMAQAISKRRKQPPTPLYQKVVLWVLAIGALFAAVAALFFR